MRSCSVVPKLNVIDTFSRLQRSQLRDGWTAEVEILPRLPEMPNLQLVTSGLL